MRKSFIFLIVAMLTLASCSTERRGLNQMRKLTNEVEAKGQYYDVEDWKEAYADFRAIDEKVDILRRQVDISIERACQNPAYAANGKNPELCGIMHVRRHLAATPLFKGIPNYRETRIAMLRAETRDEVFAFIEKSRQMQKACI